MILLLDTHAFLWFEDDNEQLSQVARNLIIQCNVVFVSIASFWEIAIKQSIGKLELDASVPEFLDDCREMGFEVLPIMGTHLERLKALPFVHRDPFDRAAGG